MTFPAQNPQSRVRQPDFLQEGTRVPSQDLPTDTASLLQMLVAGQRQILAYLKVVLRAGATLFVEPTITSTAMVQIDLSAEAYSINIKNDGPQSVLIYIPATVNAAPRTVQVGEFIAIETINPPLRFIGAAVATAGNSAALRIAGLY